MFSDRAFANLPDKISSGSGHIVFITGSAGEGAAPIAWTSNKVKRVVESTPAAEALSLQEAIAHGSYLRAVVAEIVDVDKDKIPIKAYTDSNNLFEAVYSTKLVKDRRLRIDMAQIQEAIQEENIELLWIPGNEMLADILTKKGVSADSILEYLYN